MSSRRGEDDVINRNFGDDLLYGDAGDDVITDDQGSNTIHGGSGNDRLISKSLSGDHNLFGDTGNDSLEATGASLNSMAVKEMTTSQFEAEYWRLKKLCPRR